LKSALARSGLLGSARSARDASRRLAWELRRTLRGVDRRLVEEHLRGPVGKLHIGCGGYLLAGWLNADAEPVSAEVLRLDATQPFALPDDRFEYVFSEHMIEHVSYGEGLSMLRECRRVLRPGGRIRISTPDLAFLIELYRRDPSELQSRYMEWSARQYPEVRSGDPAFVINNFVRDWGHRFIYDEASLRRSLTEAGFSSLRRCQLQESADPALRNLENEGRMPPSFLRLETMTIEGEKATPARPAPYRT
jgi:predicted SAM-dependent methyltransferase